MNICHLANFERLQNIEIGETYQYKEGGIIFNFNLTSVKTDDEYLFIEGEIDEKTKSKYGIEKLDLTLSLKPFYYSGMVKIMPKDTYIFIKS
jgi:hypothetical protein